MATIALSQARIRAGRSAKVVTRLHKTPFERTTPRSAPIFNRMKQSIIKLTTVVKALLRMEGVANLTALAMACSFVTSGRFSCR